MRDSFIDHHSHLDEQHRHDRMYDSGGSSSDIAGQQMEQQKLGRETGADGRHENNQHDTIAAAGADDGETTDTAAEQTQLPSDSGEETAEASPLLPSTTPDPSLKRRDSGVSDSESDDDLPELSRWQLIGLCLPAAAVMVGWAVGEALLLPYLLSLGVHASMANFAFLINPLFGLFLQPLFGRWSDQCTLSWGRRRPFLMLFCLGSVFGLTLVVWSAEVAYLLSGGSMGKGSVLQIVFVFAGFATMDLCTTHTHSSLLHCALVGRRR